MRDKTSEVKRNGNLSAQKTSALDSKSSQSVLGYDSSETRDATTASAPRTLDPVKSRTLSFKVVRKKRKTGSELKADSSKIDGEVSRENKNSSLNNEIHKDDRTTKPEISTNSRLVENVSVEIANKSSNAPQRKGDGVAGSRAEEEEKYLKDDDEPQFYRREESDQETLKEKKVEEDVQAGCCKIHKSNRNCRGITMLVFQVILNLAGMASFGWIMSLYVTQAK